MHDKTNTQETAESRYVGRFSEGIEQLPETPSKRRVGRFSAGIEYRRQGKRPKGRFSEGIEQLARTPRSLRRGSFADGYATCSGPAASEKLIAALDANEEAVCSSPWPHSRHDAEVEDIVHALRGFGVLTRAHLVDVCGAAHWSDSGFKRALAHAVSTGRIRRLGDDLYEIAEPPSR